MTAPDPDWLRLRAQADPDDPATWDAMHTVYRSLTRGGTTPGGLPYPAPTDPIAEGADAIRTLAEGADIIGRTWRGIRTGDAPINAYQWGGAAFIEALTVAPGTYWITADFSLWIAGTSCWTALRVTPGGNNSGNPAYADVASISVAPGGQHFTSLTGFYVNRTRQTLGFQSLFGAGDGTTVIKDRSALTVTYAGPDTPSA